MATRVQIPEPGLYVQTIANEQNPGGNVVFLNPGWNELDGEMANNPLLKKLVPEDNAAQERRYQMYQAEQTRAEAVSQAGIQYTQEAVDVDNKNIEEMRKLEEARAKRVEEDLKRGVTRTEPHPDPQAQHAIAITAGPGASMMVSSAGMASKVEPPYAPAGSPGTGPGSGANRPGAGGEAPATAPPVNRDVPHVTGDGTVGSTLNCTKGNWDNMGGEGQVSGTYAYAWQTDGTPNSATGENYNVVAGDVGKSISCIVTGTNSLGSVAAPVSNAVTITEGNGARSGNPQSRRTTV